MSAIWNIIPAQNGASGFVAITAGTAKFYQLNNNTPTGVTAEDLSVDITCLVPTIISQFWGRVDAAPGTGKNVVVTLYVNGVATILTFTISDSGVESSDVTHIVNLNPGDYYCYKVTPDSGASSTKLQCGAIVSV